MKEAIKYNIIIIICLIIVAPIGLIQLLYLNQWKKNETEQSKMKLENSLRLGLQVLFLIITLICFLFYHFGRKFIEVMGTFW